MKKIFTLFFVLILSSTVQAFSEITKLDLPELISPKNGDYFEKGETISIWIRNNQQYNAIISNIYDSDYTQVYRDSMYIGNSEKDTLYSRTARFQRCGIYYIILKGYASNGDTILSDSCTIFMGGPEPTKIELIYPQNDTNDVNDIPVFIWKEPTYKYQNYINTKYSLYISYDSVFMDIYKVIDVNNIDSTRFKPDIKLFPNTTYYWVVQANNNCALSPYSETWHFTTSPYSGINKQEIISFLINNIPNPCSESTKFRFTLPESGYIKLSISNAYGKEIALVTNGFYDSGFHEIEWAAPNLPSGVYYYKLSASGFVQTKRMVVIR